MKEKLPKVNTFTMAPQKANTTPRVKHKFSRPSKMVSFKFTQRLEIFQKLSTGLDWMSAPASEGAFHGTRSQTRPTVADISDEGDRCSTMSRSPKPSTKIQLAASGRGSKPTGILKKGIQKPPYKGANRSPSRSDVDDIPSIIVTRPASSEDTVNDSVRPDAEMSSESRPKLKLSFSRPSVPTESKNGSGTPAATPGSATTPSLKLKIKKPAPPPSGGLAPPTPAKSHKPKKADGKASALKSSAKKRKKPQEDDGESSGDELARAPQKIKKIRFLQKAKDEPQTPATPILKLKSKGKIPKRPLGVGYDSELSDREQDPVVSEAFVLRMPPGPDYDYVQNAVENNLIGLPIREGGADIRMQFWDRHGRRALVTIRNRKYAATVVDLPCIIEGMKSWDKKGWIKSADISQMLLVLGPVESDEQSQSYELPPEVDQNTWQYAHGITPPMHHVRKRRFARTKRTSLSAIEAVERKVAQLLADDNAAQTAKWEVLDHDAWAREEYEREHSLRQSYDEDMDGYEDAEGEEVDEDYFSRQDAETPAAGEEEEDDEEVAAELEGFLQSEDEGDEAPALATANGTAPSQLQPTPGGTTDPDASFAITSTSASPSAATAAESATAVPTPAAIATPSGATTTENEEESDEDDSGDDEDDADAADSDDEAAAGRREMREKVTLLDQEIRKQKEAFAQQKNPIIKRKIQHQLQRLQAERETAARGAGMGEDEEEDGGAGQDGD